MNALRSSLCVALGLLAAGCFLEELKVRCIDSRADCHALNVANEIDDQPGAACKVYQCRADGRGCELRPRDYDDDGSPDLDSCADELEGPLDCNEDPDGGDAFYPDAEDDCDDLDNDCDGTIDEEAFSEEKVTWLPPQNLDPPAISHVSYSDPGEGRWWGLTGSTPAFASTRLVEADGPMVLMQPLMQDDASCNGGGCTMVEVALASAESLLLAVGIRGKGCGAGQLRIGVSLSPGKLTWDGVCEECRESDPTGAFTSNLGQGVDLEGMCSVSGPQAGASSPSVALLPDGAGRPQDALALWRAGPATASALPLVGMPLALDRPVRNERRVSAVQGWEHSQPFGSHAKQGRQPALIRPWAGAGRRGYLVAYDHEAGIELAYVPGGMSVDFAAVRTFSIDSPGVQQLSLALRTTEDEAAPELTLAWRASRAARSMLFIARLVFDPLARSPFSLMECGSIHEVADVSEGPSLAYQPTSFGAAPSNPDGYFLSWVERNSSGQTLMGARFSRVEPASQSTCEVSRVAALLEPPFRLRQAKRIEHLFAFKARDGTASYAFISTDPGQSLNIGSLRCRERPSM